MTAGTKTAEKEKPGILVFIDWYRPAYKAGGPVRSLANMVDQLKGDFDFYILTRNRDLGSTEGFPEIEADRWLEREGIRVCYCSKAGLRRRALKEKAENAGCAIWYVNGIYSWYFSILPLLLAASIKPKKVLIAARGMLQSHALAVKGCKKQAFLQLARRVGLYRRAIFHATSNEEAEAIRRLLGAKTRVKMAPNLLAVRKKRPPERQKNRGELKLLFLGRISPEKGTLEAIRYLPLAGHGKLSLHIVGKDSNPGYAEECRLAAAEAGPGREVIFHGALPPAKVEELMDEMHFLLLPTTGENFGHAIPESLQSGLPVIISDRTPWKGVEDAGAGRVVALGDEKGFERALKEALNMDRKSYAERSRSAQNYLPGLQDMREAFLLNKTLFTDD